MKDLLSFLKDYGITPIVSAAGVFTLTMFALSLIPTMNWIPKMVVLFILTH